MVPCRAISAGRRDLTPCTVQRHVSCVAYITARSGWDRLRERNKRDSHILTAMMHSARLVEQAILVRNISSRGLGARTRGTVPTEGEEVHIQLDGRSLVGRVRWVRGDRFGIYLRDPFDTQVQPLTHPWSRPIESTPSFHVADRFKPVGKAWRPGVVGLKRAIPSAR